MTTYTSYDLVAFGEPLEKRERRCRFPKARRSFFGYGARVFAIRICTSPKVSSISAKKVSSEWKTAACVFPLALGHEIIGEVVGSGPDAKEVTVGRTMLVFPWIGCGACRACAEDRENDCMKMRSIGLVQDGGYATHVLVDHPRFLVDVEGMDLDKVAPYACSGLTVYNALKKVGPVRDDEWFAIMGAGGLGLNAIAIARAMGHERIVAIDNDKAKLQAARSMGAHAVLDSAHEEDALDRLRKLADNKLLAVLDTVGVPSTSRLAVHALVKTGRYVVVGLHGGDFKMPLPWLPQKALTVRGCHVGSSGELRELIALVKTGKVKEIPVTLRPLSEVGEALDDLKAGRVTGRVVLNAD